MKIVAAPTWVGRFVTIVICTVGAAFACSSASNGPAMGNAGSGQTLTGKPEAGAKADMDPKDAGADAACVPSSVGIATVDAGALFGCYQTACSKELSGCATDCVCNGAIMSGLQCLLADAGSAQDCFYSPILRNAADPTVRSAGTCLELVLMDGGCERNAGGQPEDGSGGEGGAPAGN
jgi:hypothetical protein